MRNEPKFYVMDATLSQCHFVVDKVTPERASVSFPQCSMLIFVYMFLFQKDKRAKKRNLEEEQWFFLYRTAMGRLGFPYCQSSKL